MAAHFNDDDDDLLISSAAYSYDHINYKYQMPVYKDCRVTPGLVNPRITQVAKTPKLMLSLITLGVTLCSWVNCPEVYPYFSKTGHQCDASLTAVYRRLCVNRQVVSGLHKVGRFLLFVLDHADDRANHRDGPNQSVLHGLHTGVLRLPVVR